jgi:hypothetical protein
MRSTASATNGILAKASLLLLLGLLSACSHPFVNALAGIDRNHGNLIVRVPAVATWVTSSLSDRGRGARGLGRAFAVADAYTIEIKNSSGDNVIPMVSESTGSIPMSAQTLSVPAGTGYTVTVSIYNAAVSATAAVVQGQATGVNVLAGGSVAVDIACLPVHPASITVDGGVVAAALGMMAEKWYAFPVAAGTHYYISQTDVQVAMALFDQGGELVASNASYIDYIALSSGTLYLCAVADGGKGTATIHVTTSPATALSLNSNSLSLIVGRAARTLTASYIPSTAGTPVVAWSSSAPSIASVSPAGVVTAVAAGTAIISATASDGASAVCPVLVGLPPAAPEMLVNGDFSSGSDFWDYGQAPSLGVASIFDFSTGACIVRCAKRGTSFRGLGMIQHDIALAKNTIYQVRFTASSTVATDEIYFAMREDGTDVNADGRTDTSWSEKYIQLSTTPQTYTATLISGPVDDPESCLVVGFGSVGSGIITLDDISLEPVGTYTPPAAPEMVNNGDFSLGQNFWTYYFNEDATALGDFSNGAFTLAAPPSTRGTKNAWDCQLISLDHSLAKFGIYHLSFDASSSVATDQIAAYLDEGGVDINGDGNLYTSWGKSTLTLGTAPQTYTYTWIMSGAYDDPSARLVFDLGKTSGTIVIDNVSLYHVGTFTPPAPPEMVYNGDFSCGSAFWNYHISDTATAQGDFSGGHFSLPASQAPRGSQKYNCILAYYPTNLTRNSVYQVSFDASSSIATDSIHVSLNEDGVDVNGNGNAYDDWGGADPVLGTTTKTYTYTWIMPATVDDPTACLWFQLGSTAGTITIDNVSLTKTGTFTPPAAPEMVYNGDFSYGSAFWTVGWSPDDINWYGLDDIGSAVPDFSTGAFTLTGPRSTPNDWDWQLTSGNKNLVIGETYQVSFDAKSTVAGDPIRANISENNVDINGDGDKYSDWYNANFNLSTSLQAYTCIFTMSGYTDPAAKLTFCLGRSAGTVTIAEVSMKPVTLISVSGSLTIALSGQQSHLAPGGSMSVTATPSQSVDSYAWYVDGAVDASNATAVWSGGSSLAVGEHSLTVVVRKNGQLFSASCYFTVS